MKSMRWIWRCVFVLLISISVNFVEAAPKITNGYISFAGTAVGGTYTPFIDILDNWGNRLDYQQTVTANFADMHNIFGASAVRLIMYPWDPSWAKGLEFPTPSQQKLNNLGAIIDAAYAQGLQVFVVMIVPNQYKYLSPSTIDNNIYVNNGKALNQNLYTFWDGVFNNVLASRMNKVAYVDIMGDIDPVNARM